MPTVMGMVVEPLVEIMDAEDYMALLLERQAAWQIAHPHQTPGFPPLLEWFIAPEDEQWVRLPGSVTAPPKKTTPRVYRSAASIRAELASVEAEMARVANTGSDDPASVNISPYARSRAVRTAGRRRFAQLDRDLEKYTSLNRRRARLVGRLATAEARESRS